MADTPDLGLGPRLLAIETALRALVDQGSSSDPELRGRIRAATETYLATIPMLSETESTFGERSRRFVEALMKPV